MFLGQRRSLQRAVRGDKQRAALLPHLQLEATDGLHTIVVGLIYKCQQHPPPL